MRKPHFKVGDPVREKYPTTSVGDEIRIVIESYESNEQYRCVVQFESGREAVLFEGELLPMLKGDLAL